MSKVNSTVHNLQFQDNSENIKQPSKVDTWK